MKRLLPLIPLALALLWLVYRQRVERVAPQIPFARVTVTPTTLPTDYYYPRGYPQGGETWCYGGGSGC